MTSHHQSIEERFRVAISDGDLATVQELLMHGMDVNELLLIEGAHDTFPLMMAIEARNIAIIKLLLEHGADMNQKVSSRTALSRAVARGDAEIVRLLLEYGADVNELLENGLSGTLGTSTALAIAVLCGKADIVRLLLEHGADVNSRGDHGTDLLQVVDMAINDYKLPHYDPEVETLLRKYGAKEYANLSDRQIQWTLARLQKGYSESCWVCRYDIKCESDKSGTQWHLFCPTGCVDVYWPKEESVEQSK